MTRKRIVTVLVALILIFITIILIFISSQISKSDISKSITPTLAPEKFESSPEVSIKKQTFSKYSIGVPDTMTANILPNTGGGDTLVMEPRGSNSKKASFTVQETDSSLSSFEKQKEIFEGLGHKSSNISFASTLAIKFTNVIPVSGTENLYETVVLFQRGGKVYQISLAYTDTSQDSELEASFSSALANFSIN